MALVAPGSDSWLALHRLRSQQIPEARRQQWLKMMHWYKHNDDEFVFDFCCGYSLPQV